MLVLMNQILHARVQALALEDKLSTLKVDELKAYLRSKQLKLTGKKQELVDRIKEAEGVA